MPIIVVSIRRSFLMHRLYYESHSLSLSLTQINKSLGCKLQLVTCIKRPQAEYVQANDAYFCSIEWHYVALGHIRPISLPVGYYSHIAGSSFSFETESRPL